MLAKVTSLSLDWVEAFSVSVEVDLSPGLPSYALVGLAAASVRESKERVVAAIRNSGFDFPIKRVTVSLAPAELRKEGTQFDLPIALGVLAASGQLREMPSSLLEETVFLGELALDGKLRPISGVLPMALKAWELGAKALVVPAENAREAAVSGLRIHAASDLRQVAEFLSGRKEIPAACEPGESKREDLDLRLGDFKEIRRQAFARRALEIAAAGGHSVILVGPPGAGKSMLAKRLATLLPPLTREEKLEISRIYSVCGMLAPGQGLVSSRPFRSPHHTISDTALVGGGSKPGPGEITLAHLGVLFLDELPEFNRDVLEVLRQPLEDFQITISRARGSLDLPARFLLAAAMNPCPCGYLGHPRKSCLCTPVQVQKYRAKISGPLWDRLDLHVEVGPVQFVDWARQDDRGEESSSQIRERVLVAREIQRRRFEHPYRVNAHMNSRQMRRHCPLDEGSSSFLKEASERLNFSARSLDRIVRVARTVADLEGAGPVLKEHLAEAVQYRSLDRVPVLG